MTELLRRPGHTETLRVGLTGGIASGKSTVSRRLSELGALVVDADAIARALQEPGEPGYEAMVAHFGERIVQPDSGALDRAAVAAIVFDDPEQLAALNGIIHPLVRRETARLVSEVPPGGVVVHDIPLLVETGQYGTMDEVLVVQAPEDERVRRMVEDRGMSPEDARRRIAAQATDEQRRAVATAVLDNSTTIEDLLAQVDEWWRTRVL
ncbi:MULTISPECIES: dephospho-CoA kinase [Kocuria]|uniref:dephospho-CoA kinase n=1 Tax=Kocuria TaxID=57493 RepID=UPI0014277BEC|nr:dephospho-CoA kinase [Kocuria sp. KD4]QIR69702.1 dephospho-CoA kinase [Kocuria sp. KD4]